jgi:hypothetical protein
MIHTFLNPLVECQVKSSLKLIIPFFGITTSITLSLPVVIICCLNEARSVNIACLLEVGHQAKCTICKFTNKNNLQALGTGAALLQVKEGY